MRDWIAVVSEDTWPEVLDIHPESWGASNPKYSKMVEVGDRFWFYMTGIGCLMGCATISDNPYKADESSTLPDWMRSHLHRYPIKLSPMVIRDPHRGLPASVFDDFPLSVQLSNGLAPWGD